MLAQDDEGDERWRRLANSRALLRQAASKGCCDSLAALIWSHQRLIRDIVQRMRLGQLLPDVGESDIINSIAGKLVGKMGTVQIPMETDKEFAAWLRTVALNHVLSKLKSAHGRLGAKALEFGSVESDENFALHSQRHAQAPGLDEMLAQEELELLVQRILAIFDALPTRDQQLLTMRFEGARTKQIVAAMGEDPNDEDARDRIRKAMQRALRRFRGRYGDRGNAASMA